MTIFKYFLPTIVFLAFWNWGCDPQGEEGWPPVARVFSDPDYVPVGITTEITLDGRKSCDPLDNPGLCDNSEDGDGAPSTCPGGITYHWNVPGRTEPLRSMTNNYSLVKVKVKIERPVEITLTVTDCDGNSSSKSLWLGVSETENNSPFPEE